MSSEAGAEDFTLEDEFYVIVTPVDTFIAVKEALEKAEKLKAAV